MNAPRIQNGETIGAQGGSRVSKIAGRGKRRRISSMILYFMINEGKAV
jgi:hypothetical protein